MRKIILITALLLSVSSSFAQKVKFGVMFAPHISSNRVNESFEQTDSVDFNKNSSGIRFSAGPVLDFYIQDNIALTFGALYTVKKASFKFKSEVSETNQATEIEPVLNLQYVSLPVGVKFITNDIASKARLYFQIGGNLDIRIAEKIKEKEKIEKITGEFKEKFSKLIDAGVNLGTGIELDLGLTNSVFLGINYNRGLVNVLSKDFGNNLKEDADSGAQGVSNGTLINKKNIKFNNDLFSLVAGFRF